MHPPTSLAASISLSCYLAIARMLEQPIAILKPPRLRAPLRKLAAVEHDCDYLLPPVPYPSSSSAVAAAAAAASAHAAEQGHPIVQHVRAAVQGIRLEVPRVVEAVAALVCSAGRVKEWGEGIRGAGGTGVLICPSLSECFLFLWGWE